MTIIQAIILGIIEGLTEFLPISSTGHLVVAERVLGYKDAAELFTVVIQMGAIAAVIWHYRQDLWQKVTGLIAKGSAGNQTRKFWANWIIATIPAAFAGLLLSSSLDKFATPKSIALSLLIGGVLILIIEESLKQKKFTSSLELEKLTTLQAFKVGSFQILALIPGVSRSGATIMGGLLSGLNRVTATAFSFYLSMPIIVLAGGYKLVKDGDKISQITGGSTALIIGTLVSFISALAAVNWLLKYVAHHNFKPFAYYRIVAGLFILLALVIF